MNAKLNIVVIDDYKRPATITRDKILGCSQIVPIGDIKLVYKYEDGYSFIKENKPDMIFSDIHLDEKTGIDLVKRLRRDGYIDYRTQVCFYTGNEKSIELLEYLQSERDLKLPKNSTTEQFHRTIAQMYLRYLDCDLANLIKASRNLLVHEIFDFTAKRSHLLAFYVFKIGSIIDSGEVSGGVKFSAVKDNLEEFDFLLQIQDYTFINTMYFKRAYKSVDKSSNTNYMITLARYGFEKDYKISESFVERAKKHFEFL